MKYYDLEEKKKKLVLVILSVLSILALTTGGYADTLQLGSPAVFTLYGLPYFIKMTDDVTGNDIVKQFSLSNEPVYLCFYTECDSNYITIKIDENTIVDSSSLQQYAQDALGWYCIPLDGVVEPNPYSLSTFTLECGPNEKHSFIYGLYTNEEYSLNIEFDKSIKVLAEKTDDNLENIKVYYLNATPDQLIKLKVSIESGDRTIIDPSMFSVKNGELLNLKNGRYSSFRANLCEDSTACIEYEVPIDNTWLYKEGYLNIYISTSETPLSAQYVISKTIKIVPQPLNIDLYINNESYTDKSIYATNSNIYIEVKPVIYSGTLNDIKSIILEFYNSTKELVSSININPNENTKIDVPDTGLTGKLIVKVMHNNGLTYEFPYSFKTFNINGLTRINKKEYMVGESVEGNISLEKIEGLDYTIENIYIVNSNNEKVLEIMEIFQDDETINFTFNIPFTWKGGTYKLITNMSINYNNQKIYSYDSLTFTLIDFTDSYKLAVKCLPSEKVKCEERYNLDSTTLINLSTIDVFDPANITLLIANVGKNISLKEFEIIIKDKKYPPQLIYFNADEEIGWGQIYTLNITIYPAYISLLDFKEDQKPIILLKREDVNLHEIIINMSIEETGLKSLDILMDKKDTQYYANDTITFKIINLPPQSRYLTANITLKAFDTKTLMIPIEGGELKITIPRNILKEGYNNLEIQIDIYLFDKKLLSRIFKIKDIRVIPAYEYDDKINTLKNICNCSSVDQEKCISYLKKANEIKELGKPLPKEIVEFIQENENCESTSHLPLSTTEETTSDIDEMLYIAKQKYKELCEIYYNDIMDYAPDESTKTQLSNYCKNYKKYYISNILRDDAVKSFYENTIRTYDLYKQLMPNIEESENNTQERRSTALIIGIIIAILVVIGVAIVLYMSIPKNNKEEEIIEDIY